MFSLLGGVKGSLYSKESNIDIEKDSNKNNINKNKNNKDNENNKNYNNDFIIGS